VSALEGASAGALRVRSALQGGDVSGITGAVVWRHRSAAIRFA
jgi:hypothetical protein